MGCWVGTKKFITIIWGGGKPRPHPLTSAVTDTTDRYGPVITVGGVGCVGGVGGDFSHTDIAALVLGLVLGLGIHMHSAIGQLRRSLDRVKHNFI